MEHLFNSLPQNILDLIYSFDSTYYDIFKENFRYIRSHNCIKLRNNSQIYPFRIIDRYYDETGLLVKTNGEDLDNHVLNKFTLNTPVMTFYKLSWSHIPSRTWLIKLLSNSVGYSEAFSIIEDFKDGDVFIMIFADNIYYDRNIKKVFVYDNGLICPEYSDDYITVKTNVYFETGPDNIISKTMRLEYINMAKYEVFVT